MFILEAKRDTLHCVNSKLADKLNIRRLGFVHENDLGVV